MKFYAALCLATCFLGGCVIEESHHEGDPFDGDGGGDVKGPPAPACTGGNGSTAGNNGTGAGGNTAGTGNVIGTGGGWSAGGTGSDSGGSAGTGGTEPPPPPPPTCTELEDEASCSERADCLPIYAGTDCSCGPDCTCIGGEPGCVCESYGFLVCIETEE